MIIISYDIENDNLRSKFSKMLMKNGAIRLQNSVYEVSNTKRVVDLIKLEIDKHYSDKFGGGDSVVIFEVNESEIIKYGNAIHRDSNVLYF